nr:MAG TPA: hypothetical protein [Caudoviricetes sp.]
MFKYSFNSSIITFTEFISLSNFSVSVLALCSCFLFASSNVFSAILLISFV